MKGGQIKGVPEKICTTPWLHLGHELIPRMPHPSGISEKGGGDFYAV
jgi:hypothetical protein